MDKLRIGLIGAGRIGRVHAECVATLPGTTLQWVCDRDTESATRVSRAQGGRVTANPRDVFEAPDVDAIIIASSTPTHVDLLQLAVEAGVPALCEKPVDLDIARVDEFRQQATSAAVPIAIGFNRRFDPHFAYLRERIASGDIGSLEQLSITSRDLKPGATEYLATSGGIFKDLTIHDFDTARSFIPSIVEVFARGATLFSRSIANLDDYDTASVLLIGAAGEQVSITNSRHAAYGFDQRVEAFGSEGLLTVGNVSDTSVRHWSATSVEALQPYQNFFLERYSQSYLLQLSEFAKAVRGEPNRCAGYDDGRAALMLANAADRSARTGQAVSVDLDGMA
ncbi:Gfo/Idh/MocA family oxidoreductase [Rudaeicoccus suwonensis]|uniref:Myo-inositol 2-dehydrogenase/D-chiro-inositol 1-dehydrogenase n=1 Tax=Rudaeicoccus suwonensis TaxID=657409 RepID=A0A561DVP1_9MICO|nr:Gfo/Idh/MocA family oxidoreductase [Rudaeicoccus suwonensis]TWE07426.1 myo-inositol 2-dehydrogenase/D-chiro-inositol 1-dehydrogenase [Rudaeicoccus suwonensis]